MTALPPRDLLDLCERGARLHPLDQGLLALAAALPDLPPAALADWTLGRRNRALLELHCACFGPRVRAWAACARCGEQMEFELDARLLSGSADQPSDQAKPITVNGRTFRLPTSRDLALAAGDGDPDRGARRLLQRCHLGEDDSRGWTDEDVQAVGERFKAADPIAELRLSLACPACGDAREETFDPVAFLWSELQAAARRTLLEIHTLASAYGWSEREILGMSGVRRSLYLQMVRA